MRRIDVERTATGWCGGIPVHDRLHPPKAGTERPAEVRAGASR